MGASTILILLFSKVEDYHMGISGFSIIVYLVGIVGFTAGIVDYAVMDIVRSCVETECESFPAAFEIWYDFTSETLVYLFTPLFMYILLNFDIIDSDASENRWLTRIMVILMLLIVSSRH